MNQEISTQLRLEDWVAASAENRPQPQSAKPQESTVEKADGRKKSGHVIDISGRQFDRLTVVEFVGVKNANAIWLCKCKCGNVIQVRAGSLKDGNTRSCGCLCADVSFARRRPMVGSAEWRTYYRMKSRCLNSNTTYYKYYGGRGIKVCPRWLESFENFYADMGPSPSPKHSLDRINNNGNYEPGNCRWATQSQQNNNKRVNHLLTYEGVTHTLTEWAFILNVPSSRIFSRIRRGWTVKMILSCPKFFRPKRQPATDL